MQDLNSKIEQDFLDYLQEIHPLIIETELLYNEFPTAVLNELRAYMTHMSRCFLYVDDKEKIKKEYESASRHILRIKIDLHKYIILGLKEKYYDQFKEEMRKVRIEVINNGKFSNEYNELYSKAVQLTKVAKRTEVESPEECFNKYTLSLEAWRELEQHVENNIKGIVNAKLKYRYDVIQKVCIFLVGAVLSAIISVSIGYLL